MKMINQRKSIWDLSDRPTSNELLESMLRPDM